MRRPSTTTSPAPTTSSRPRGPRGISTVVWASSETVLGLPFAHTPPPYIPVDEEYHPRPQSAYSLAKTLEEEMAAQFCRWDPDLSMTGLRFSNVMDPADYAAFPGFDADPDSRMWNLWGYIDARDGAQAVRLALEAAPPGNGRLHRGQRGHGDEPAAAPSSPLRCSRTCRSPGSWPARDAAVASTRPSAYWVSSPGSAGGIRYADDLGLIAQRRGC